MRVEQFLQTVGVAGLGRLVDGGGLILGQGSAEGFEGLQHTAGVRPERLAFDAGDAGERGLGQRWGRGEKFGDEEETRRQATRDQAGSHLEAPEAAGCAELCWTQLWRFGGRHVQREAIWFGQKWDESGTEPDVNRVKNGHEPGRNRGCIGIDPGGLSRAHLAAGRGILAAPDARFGRGSGDDA